MSKKIWEITHQDLSEHPVWYFPMSEDDGCDEVTVIPANKEKALDPNSLIIVKTKFTDSIGTEFNGYIYYGLTELGYSQPCMFVENRAVAFWFGIVKPKQEDLVQLQFPVVATSIPIYGLVPKSIRIDGYGFIDEDNNEQLMYCE